MKWYLILPLFVFFVSCCDLGATLYFSKTNNGFEEANPIALYIWDNHGDTALGVFKLTVTFASCICMGWVLRYKNQPWKIAVSIFGLGICALLIGWWNFWIFYGMIV